MPGRLKGRSGRLSRTRPALLGSRIRETRMIAEGEIESRKGFSPLPIFEFDGIPSASVQTKHFCGVVGPSQDTFSAGVRPVGGQDGGQNSAREIHVAIFTCAAHSRPCRWEPSSIPDLAKPI